MKLSNVRGTIRHQMLFVLVAALAAGLGMWFAQKQFAPVPAASAPLALRSVTLFPAGRALAPYKLEGADGSAITPATMKGHWTLVYLGFTHCPDVCPTTLQMLGLAAKSWAALPAATRPRILFVSVDPGRDTPQRVGEYAHYFGKDIAGATADEATLTTFARSLGTVYLKVPTSGSDYTIDHSASVSLLDPNGDMAGVIQPQPPPAQAFDPAAIGADMITLSKAGTSESN